VAEQAVVAAVAFKAVAAPTAPVAAVRAVATPTVTAMRILIRNFPPDDGLVRFAGSLLYSGR
jgi:hypothetical protein